VFDGRPLQKRTYTFRGDFNRVCASIRRELIGQADVTFHNDSSRGVFYAGRQDEAKAHKVWGVVHAFKGARGDRMGSFRAAPGWVTLVVYEWDSPSFFDRATAWLTSQL
jgi:hypothetical protein